MANHYYAREARDTHSSARLTNTYYDTLLTDQTAVNHDQSLISRQRRRFTLGIQETRNGAVTGLTDC